MARLVKVTGKKNYILKRELDEVIDVNNVKLLAHDLKREMFKLRGIGLAANQIGYDTKVAVIYIDHIKQIDGSSGIDNNFDNLHTIINPSYNDLGNQVPMIEGCLSDPDKEYMIYRSDEIVANWIDFQGRRHERVLRGMLARVFQHETDHLNGVSIRDIGEKVG